MTRISHPEVEELLAWLLDVGFGMENEVVGVGFGDTSVTVVKGRFRVRIVSDRGMWFLEATVTDKTRWFDIDIWRACVQQEAVPRDPRTFGQQARFLRAELRHMEDAVSQDEDGLWECMVAFKWVQVRTRLGLADESAPP